MNSTCKRRNKHHVSSPILFFKIIVGKTLEDGKLKLPNNFTRKYGGGLSKPVVFLKPPDGTEWKVCWTKLDDEIFLEKGWEEFATYYTLSHGHLMLFEYKKETTCHFEVHIFDITGLEIDYPLNDEEVEILDEMPPRQKKTKQKSPMLASPPRLCKKLRIGTSGDNGRTSYNLQDLPQLHQIKLGNRSQGTSLQKSKFASVNKKSYEDIGGGITQCPKVEKSTKVTEALSRARTLRSGNPSFMVVMTPSYANENSVSIPSKFAKEYLKGKKGATLLQVQGGRTWSATYSVGNIYSGWKRFASDNNLKVGDICVFELTDLKGLSFKVSISRAAQELPNCSQSQAVQEDRVKLLDPGRVQYVESKADIKSKGQKETQRTSLVISPKSGTDGAMKEAEKFASENPFFIVSIRPRPWTPVVPTAFIIKYLGKKKQILKLQFGNKLWPVKLLCYAYNTPSKLSDGWLLFLRETELQAGDVCIFELINREDSVFNVHIFRCNY